MTRAALSPKVLGRTALSGKVLGRTALSGKVLGRAALSEKVLGRVALSEKVLRRQRILKELELYIGIFEFKDPALTLLSKWVVFQRSRPSFLGAWESMTNRDSARSSRYQGITQNGNESV